MPRDFYGPRRNPESHREPAMSLIVIVEVHVSMEDFCRGHGPIRRYEMDHDDPIQRRVLGEQCRNAFEGGQCVVTRPKRIKP